MTDINEIIGRALLTFKNEDDDPLVQETGTGEFFMEGSLAFADIGAAVVKALGEAGYEVRPMDKVTELPIVREYEDGSQIRAVLGHNEYYVDFEIWGGLGENLDVEVRGFVKWDGCMNWETSPRCMYHFCSKADAERLSALFKDVWDEGRKLMPRADADYGEP